MDPTEWVRKCHCGLSFYKPNSFSNHINSCRRYKKDVGDTLQNAKARYAKKVKSKKGTEAIETWLGESSLDVDAPTIPAPQPNPEPPPMLPMPEEPRLELPGGRGFRLRVPTNRYKDFALTSAIPLVIPMSGEAIESPRSTPPPPDTPLPTAVVLRRSVLHQAEWKVTQRNGFGLYKMYWTTETMPHDPDLFISDSDLKDGEDPGPVTVLDPPSSLNRYYPFPNRSSYMLGDWYWDDRTGKSRESFQQLVGIITDPSFKPDDIRQTNWNKVNDILASSDLDSNVGQEAGQWMDDGASWVNVPVVVDVPFNSTSDKPGIQPFQVDGFRYRPLIPIIAAKLKDPESADHFHIVPSELRWQGGNGETARVYGDLYHSDAFLDAYREIQLLPPEPNEDDLPRCVVALMFASDETMLTSFGNAKLWPVYMMFGNETKYRRGKVSLKLAEEVAYFQSLPDAFHDWYRQASGKRAVGDPLLTHVKRELFHAQWKVLLDNDFIHAYEHGLVVGCCDGVRRRVYPRIMTYSADYPERVTVVGIRHIGDHPCPRCFVSQGDIQFLGTRGDMLLRSSQERKDDGSRKEKVAAARHAIYKQNYTVNSAVVERHLKPTSLVPAQNAFSDLLSKFGFDMYRMLSVDVLHEVEIGCWKSLFIHLLRLLEAIDPTLIGILNSRFRQMPTFGRDTIRRFIKNVADRKQFGAREYEDVLQCGIPAFEGLFPEEHEERIMGLLYSIASWHSFAKLRMHTDQSLAILDRWTSILGQDARDFTTLTCSAFETRELKKEYEARKRAEARKRSAKAPKEHTRAKGPGATIQDSSETPGDLVADPDTNETEGRRHRTWNLSTPKFHGLGDVVACIKRFGTTDSYSTQMSERFHTSPKSRYRRTNKKDVARQLSRIQTRQARIKKLRRQLYPSPDEKGLVGGTAEPTRTPIYFIGKSQNQPVNLSHFIRLNANDPAVKGFLHKLKQHLFPRVIETLIEEARAQPERHGESLSRLSDFSRSNFVASDRDIDTIYFHSDTIYKHSVFQIHYTTYDCRQDCDTLNPSTSRRDFMCIADGDADVDDRSEGTSGDGAQYVYGRLLGVFHANILYMGPGAFDYRRRRFDFLWVRWFESASANPSRSGPSEHSKQLDRVRLVPLSQARSWGFINPSHILRAVHLLPRFALQTTNDDVDTDRIFSKCARERRDWEEYYVNRFVDRDMIMRFHPGAAVGHSSAQANSVREQPRSDTPMEVDAPPVKEDETMAAPQTDSLTDSEDSNYERRDDEVEPQHSDSEYESEIGSLEQEPDSEDSSTYS